MKKTIIILVTLLLCAALIAGIWFFIDYQRDQKTVDVISVNNVSTQYWGDEAYSQGVISLNNTQEIYYEQGKALSEVFVQPGDTVSVGDPLLQYDKTLEELNLEGAELAVLEADIKIDTAKNQLKKLQNTKPVSTAAPTVAPTPTVKPTASPSVTPTPTPSPTPIPGADVTLYSRIDITSAPYMGSGSTEDPYRFLCTDDCIITKEFIQWLFGTHPDPDSVSELTTLVSPFAAVFEVREGDSNYGAIISSFSLDGTSQTGSIDISNVVTGSNTIETLAQLFTAPAPSEDNYNHMNYTADELKKLIAEKKQQITDLELEKKRCNLELQKSQLAVDNTVVSSTVDGMVQSVTDLETAQMTDSPLMIISGDSSVYVTGVISESLLGSVQLGDTVVATSWSTMMSYNAQITGISTDPLEDEGYFYGGVGNPNSSNYEFTAVMIDDASDLKDGDYVELTINVNPESGLDALYIWKPYLKDDDAGTYVMKVGDDENRLVKQYLEIGRSIYNGEYIEVISGLSNEDYIAFPGTDAKEGVRAKMPEDFVNGAGTLPEGEVMLR